MNEMKIMKKLDRIEKEIGFIKDHLIDADLLITDDDLDSIKQAKGDLENDETERIA
jgi:hypothetical protein